MSQEASHLASRGELQRATEKEMFSEIKREWGKRKLLAKNPLFQANVSFQGELKRSVSSFPSADQEIPTVDRLKAVSLCG